MKKPALEKAEFELAVTVGLPVSASEGDDWTVLSAFSAQRHLRDESGPWQEWCRGGYSLRLPPGGYYTIEVAIEAESSAIRLLVKDWEGNELLNHVHLPEDPLYERQRQARESGPEE